MKTAQPTTLPGDKLRRAIDEYSELRKKNLTESKTELIAIVSQKFDLSPLENEFLIRQLGNC